MAKRGGKRDGAGRKPGSLNNDTRDVREFAQEYGPRAIEKLVALLECGTPSVERAAATDLLDRGYGKPTQPLANDPTNPLTPPQWVVQPVAS